MAENERRRSSLIHVIWTRFYAHLNEASYTLTFHNLGTFSSYVLSAFASSLEYYLFYFRRVDQFITSFNQSIAFIVPLLTTFLQLKYHADDQKKTPFATHPRTMRVAISSSIFYYLAYIALLRFPQHRSAVVAHYCMMWCGYASIASLASVLLPELISPFIYAIFLLLSTGELFYFLYHKLVVEEEEAGEFQAYGRRIRRFLNNLCRVVANSSMQQPHILPV